MSSPAIRSDRPGSARPDKNGNLWMEMAGGLSRLNPDTGEIKTWRLSEFNDAFIHEILPTDDGSVWLTLERQGGLARFDTRAEKFEVFIDQKMIDDYNVAKPVQKDPNDPFPNLPDPRGPQGGGARSHTAAVDHDGNIWVSGRPLKKLDAKTGRFTFYNQEAPDCYGIAVDHKGNVWFAQFNARDHQNIGVVDAKTKKITLYTPPAGVSPRRLKVDSKGMVWIGDYFGGSLTRFDPTTQEFKVFKLPGPMPTPYGMEVDLDDNVWYASMYTDVMGKLDPKTGKVTEYPSPYGERGTRDMVGRRQGPALVRRAALFQGRLCQAAHRGGKGGGARQMNAAPLSIAVNAFALHPRRSIMLDRALILGGRRLAATLSMSTARAFDETKYPTGQASGPKCRKRPAAL